VVTNQQLYLAIGVPMLFNFGLIGLVLAYMNSRFTLLQKNLDLRFDEVNRRFDDMRDLWRAELHRVEEVLDARLKHLEER
jgi:hypothetical protein